VGIEPTISANERPQTYTLGRPLGLAMLILVYLNDLLLDVGRVVQSVQRLSYELEVPGSNPGWDEIFRPSRPTLGPTQPPVNWVPGLFRG